MKKPNPTHTHTPMVRIRLTEPEFDTLVTIVYEQINVKAMDDDFDMAEALLALARAINGMRKE